MRLRCKWRFLLIPPLVAVLGFYLFLIGANYYYARRAAYLLDKIRILTIDSSSIAELKRLGSERGFRYEEATDCASVTCIHMVSPNNQWMWSILGSPILVRVRERIGLRAWFAVGDIEIKNGQVIGKIYGLQFYPEMEAEAWHELKLQLNPCTYYPLKRHPGYGFRNASNVRSFRVMVSDTTSTENRDRAFQFNVNCLTGWHKCEQFAEIMPAAWADYEEDANWSETHPNPLVWQVGTECPY